MQFTALLPKEAEWHYAGKGVSLGAADKPIFWYRPKDAKKYRVIYADLSVREAGTPPSVPDVTIAQMEQALIEMLRHYSELFGGPFPNSLELEQGSLVTILSTKLSLKFIAEGVQQPTAKQQQELTKAMMQFTPGLMFAASRPPEADAHYAGRGVSLGAAERPIYWYRPPGSKKYRVIYGDLSVRDADTPPSVPKARPEADLIDELRNYSRLSGGPFPDSLDQECCPRCWKRSLVYRSSTSPTRSRCWRLWKSN